MLVVGRCTCFLVDLVTEGGDGGMFVETDFDVTLGEIRMGEVQDESVGVEIFVFVSRVDVIFQCDEILIVHWNITHDGRLVG